MTKDKYCRVVLMSSKRLYLLSMSFTHNHHDSEDICQNVFLKLWKYNGEFESDEHIDKWLTIVCINECKNYLKASKRYHQMSNEDFYDLYNPPNEESLDLFNAVMKLPRKESSVIQLYYYDELSVKEISSLLGISISAAKARLMRGRQHLKEYLGDDFYEE